MNVSTGGHEDPDYAQNTASAIGTHIPTIGTLTGGLPEVQSDDGSYLELLELDVAGVRGRAVTIDSFGDFWFHDLEASTFSLKIESDGKTKTVDSISTDEDVNLGDIPLS